MTYSAIKQLWKSAQRKLGYLQIGPLLPVLEQSWNKDEESVHNNDVTVRTPLELDHTNQSPQAHKIELF